MGQPFRSRKQPQKHHATRFRDKHGTHRLLRRSAFLLAPKHTFHNSSRNRIIIRATLTYIITYIPKTRHQPAERIALRTRMGAIVLY
jgi:hypothetical protein